MEEEAEFDKIGSIKKLWSNIKNVGVWQGWNSMVAIKARLGMTTRIWEELSTKLVL